MKSIILSVLLITSLNIYAQESINIFSNGQKYKVLNTINNSNDIVTVRDSMKIFIYNIDHWEATTKTITSTFNQDGRIVSEETFDSIPNNWQKKSKANYTYDENINSPLFGNEHVNEFTKFAWNTNSLSWSDTIDHTNLTPFFNKLFNEYVYEDKIISRTWDYTTSELTSGYRINFNLIDDSLYTEITYKLWKPATQTYGNYTKKDFLYNGDEYLDTLIYKEWNNSKSGWENNLQYIFTHYNEDITVKIFQAWSGSSWGNEHKHTYAYDTNHNKIEDTDYTWAGSNWYENFKFFYTYNASDSLLTKTKKYWNGSSWQNNKKETTTYDSHNNKTNFLIQTWNSSASSWNNSTQENYTYSGQNLTEYLYQYWDGSNWVDYIKITYSYINDNLTGYLYQTWDIDKWKNVEKKMYSYDGNNKTQYIYQTWDVDADSWINKDKEEYYWSEHEYTFVEKTLRNNFKIFPNPTNGIVNILNNDKKIKSIIIIDVSGKLLYNNNYINKNTYKLNLKEFGNGLYIIKIKNNDNKTYSSKIIVN